MTHLHKGRQVTFAQTWYAGYGTDEETFAAPLRPAAGATTGPRLAPQCSAPQCSGSRRQPPAAMTGPDAIAGTASVLCQILLSVGPEAAKAARDFTASTLSEWQLDDLVHEAVLIASELVTNAIRHGRCCSAGGT